MQIQGEGRVQPQGGELLRAEGGGHAAGEHHLRPRVEAPGAVDQLPGLPVRGGRDSARIDDVEVRGTFERHQPGHGTQLTDQGLAVSPVCFAAQRLESDP